MLSLPTLGGDAYAVSIRDHIETRTGISLGRSSVYVTLDRLERKGYVRSALGEPTAERGGKAKRCFAITGDGARALKEAERAVSRMRTASATRDGR